MGGLLGRQICQSLSSRMRTGVFFRRSELHFRSFFFLLFFFNPSFILDGNDF